MTFSTIKTSSFKSQLVDLSVLSICFLLFAYITDYAGSGRFGLDQLLYILLGFVSLRLSKYLVCKLFHISSCVGSVLLGNIIGFMLWVLIAVLLETLFSANGKALLVVVSSSIMAFFILGTLSPMVKSSHHDIIRH